MALITPNIASADVSPPSQLELGPNSARPHVEGERPPTTTARLPARLPAITPKAKPKPKPKPVKPKPPVLRPRPEPAEPPGSTLVLFDVGRVSVPRQIVVLAANADRFPDLIGVSVDISVLRASDWHHAYGVRVGLLTPSVPATNWYLDAPGSKPPVYTEVDLIGLDVAFEYAYRRKLIGPVGVMLRGGLGLAVAVGSLRRVETLPGCADEDRATCPHWRKAGVQPNALPSPVWPAVHATAGLFVELAGRFGLHVEAGVRDAVYVGAGVSLRP